MSTVPKAEGHPRAAAKLRTVKSGGSRAEWERDSGFSDASSEHAGAIDTTDSEDTPGPTARQGTPRPLTSRLAVVGGSYSGLSPMIIMNNVLLDQQPADNTPALKPWGFRPAVEVVKPVVKQPQVVFLQPVVSRRPSSKDASPRHRRPKKYLPLLKSYPKIAPHPGDGSSSSGRGTASSSLSSSLSYSSSSSSSVSERCSVLTSSHRQRHQRDKKKHKTPSRSLSTSTTTTTALSVSGPPGERLFTAATQGEFRPSVPRSDCVADASKVQALSLPAPQAQEGGCHGEGDGPENKRKRFCNTYNILSKSGLLDIALRTKELLRQNWRTQSDLEHLQENTELFLQALQSGDASICLKLQSRLQEEEEEKEKERGPQNSMRAD